MFRCEIGEGAELRLLEVRYAEELYRLVERNRMYLRQWLAWLDMRRTLGDFEEYIRGGLRRFAENNGFEAGIWFEGKLAGVICYHGIDWPHRRTSIGYWIGEEFQGHGLVTRACAVMVDHALGELGLNRVELECATQNVKSQAIPERLGFVREGLIRQPEWLYDHFVDHYLYGMLANEWADVRMHAPCEPVSERA